MKVLVAVDNSECSAEAIRFAAASKWPENTTFRVITVIEPIYLEFGIPAPYTAYMEEAEQAMIRERSQMVSNYATQIKEKTGCPAEHVAIGGLVASTILDHAKDWQADMIVLGSHGRRGLQKLLLGSVAERVACLAPCTVQIVRSRTGAMQSADHNDEGVQACRKQ